MYQAGRGIPVFTKEKERRERTCRDANQGVSFGLMMACYSAPLEYCLFVELDKVSHRAIPPHIAHI